MKPTLLILAAGVGSRYGGLKQLDPLGSTGETIMEYSIYDALKAGFGKVVFVIRKEFMDEFDKRFSHLKSKTSIAFTFQEVNPIFEGVENITLREKPWGTVHAVLTASKIIKEPFAVINADDFYGQEAFNTMSEFLKSRCTETYWAMVGYQLKNTLSTHGAVSRGVCKINESGMLNQIKECKGIQGHDDKMSYKEGDKEIDLSTRTIASMNFWGFHPHFFQAAEKLFKKFVLANATNPKSEMTIPDLIQPLLDKEIINVSALVTNEKWFGVTHKGDKSAAMIQLQELIKTKVYPERLWQ